ncbi:hypothetical protein M409DRAFT_37588 [Zasmidium cellare ATCC 36951]|uniref:Major facilitator superfamily (MFS) profile domain-containing protein n=1 Tax=Zasmidium cellare ATCC 36951 TaxID=1080233 RepID=A0A6A6C5M1_ZASCE|nr:uncharacterized protein M409DRAFT_37588 [Zasmidium cellare ATCC 36951]KAF2161172.1 hypothetical protein M409DRAFT_37588 [Zasmidium cellare ATCC 36951]
MSNIQEKHTKDIDYVENCADGSEVANPDVNNTVDQFGSQTKKDAREVRLIRKLDWIIFPCLWVMYFFNFLDRTAITVAKLDKLDKDLGISSVQYNTCISILFVGYVIRPSLFMAGWMALWSVTSTLTGITHNYVGLFLTRFFLGICEAPFYPGALYMLSMFYTKKEVATRISILFTGSICGVAFAGLIAIGIFEMEGVAGLAGWRWVFILQGIVSFGVAVASAFILPDEPTTTWWLSEEERELANDRVVRDTVEIRAGTSTWKGLQEACRDYRMWIIVLMQHLHIAASNFKNFFPTIVGTLGFGRNTTLALTCPPYLFAGAVSIVYAWNSGRMNERTWHITIAKLVAIAGFIMACATLNTAVRYVGMFFFAMGVYNCQGIQLGWMASTCGQTREKKAVSLAMANMIGNIATIYTPYLWPASNAPRYDIPFSASAAFSVGVIICAWGLRYCLKRENKRIQRTEPEGVLLYAY